MTSTDPILEVRGVSKKYSKVLARSLRYGLSDLIGEYRPGTTQRELRPSEFWALRDITFSVERGQSFGVIGSNGAGKSTLLSAIAGITKPDEGEIILRGSVGALLEAGAGLEPLLTGRENIRASAALWGADGDALAGLAAEIIDFADIGAFIDAPVHTYSQGMRLRLGYSIVTMAKPDLLLIDEALAVGDVGFRLKCMEHIRRFVDGGGSLILVSHTMFAIQGICQDALVLDDGTASFVGPASEATQHYFKIESLDVDEDPSEEGAVAGPVRIESVVVVELESEDDRRSPSLMIELGYYAEETIERANWGFMIFTADQAACIAGDMIDSPRDMVTILPGRGRLRCVVDDLPITPGSYVARAVIVDADTMLVLDASDRPETVGSFVLDDSGEPSEQNAIERMSGAPLVHLEPQWLQPGS